MMAGFWLAGHPGRVPCPHCGGTDCAGVDDADLVCLATGKIVTESMLREVAHTTGPLYTIEVHRLDDGWGIDVLDGHSSVVGKAADSDLLTAVSTALGRAGVQLSSGKEQA